MQLDAYVSLPIVRRLGGCAPGEGLTQTSVGVLRVREHRGEDGRTEFVPVEFQRRDGSAQMVINESGPQLRLRGSRGWLTLTPEGIQSAPLEAVRGRATAARRSSFTETSVARLARQMLTDEELRASVAGLQRDLWLATMEHAAVSETVPSGGLQPSLTTTSTTIGTATQPPASGTDACSVEVKVTKIVKEVWGWVQSVKTAAQQAEECRQGCTGKTGWDWAWCQGQCLIGFFRDIFESTYKVIGTITTENIELLLHCPTRDGSVPTYTGRVPGSTAILMSGAVPPEPQDSRDESELARLAKEAVGTIGQSLGCVLGGDWQAWRHDFDPRDPERGLVGVQVCIDGDCAKKLRDSLGAGAILAAIDLLRTLVASPAGAAAVLAAMEKMTSTKLAIDALVGILGIEASAAAGLVLGFLILVLYQTLAVIGQLLMMGSAIDNGVCLRHPSLLVAAGFFLLPAVAVSWPVTVSKR